MSQDGEPHPFTIYTSDTEGNLVFKSYMPRSAVTEYRFMYDEETAGSEILQVTDIEIRPFSSDKKLNIRSSAAVPVAILSSTSFDATLVNEDSLGFGVTGSEESLHFCLRNNLDVNNDGLKDKTCWFRIKSMNLHNSSTEVVLKGENPETIFISKQTVEVY